MYHMCVHTLFPFHLFLFSIVQTETAREEYECLKAVQSEEMHVQLEKITTAELVCLAVQGVHVNIVPFY